MMNKITPPEDVLSPKQHWNLIAVLDDGSSSGEENNCALALGRWDNNPVLAVRWNRHKDNPIGNPQSRGVPTWFILPEKYNEAILQLGAISPEKVALARNFIPLKGDQENNPRYINFYRDKNANKKILKELIQSNGEKHYNPNLNLALIQNLHNLNLMHLIEEVREAEEVTYRITDEGRKMAGI
jgi:hypothetical protein